MEMTEEERRLYLAKILISIGMILLVTIFVAGCTGQPEEWKNITVKDRVMTTSFGYHCSCAIATTDGNAYKVSQSKDCALLSPNTPAMVRIGTYSSCDIREVRVLP